MHDVAVVALFVGSFMYVRSRGQDFRQTIDMYNKHVWHLCHSLCSMQAQSCAGGVCPAKEWLMAKGVPDVAALGTSATLVVTGALLVVTMFAEK